MTDATVTKKSKNPKAPKLFPDELIDQFCIVHLIRNSLNLAS